MCVLRIRTQLLTHDTDSELKLCFLIDVFVSSSYSAKPVLKGYLLLLLFWMRFHCIFFPSFPMLMFVNWMTERCLQKHQCAKKCQHFEGLYLWPADCRNTVCHWYCQHAKQKHAVYVTYHAIFFFQTN